MFNWRFIKSTQALFQLIGPALLLCLLFIFNGCSTQMGMGLDSESIQIKSILPVPDSPQLPAVIKRLMDLADEQYHQSKISDSIVTLERAIRIKPRFPEIWSRMAYIYAHLDKPVQATQYAERSNSYISNSHPLRTFNDNIINSANR